MKKDGLVVIGLVGAKGSGKSTFARLVRDRYPFVREGALADKLKDVCALATEWPRHAFDDPALKETYHPHKVLGGWYHSGPFQLNRHTIASAVAAFGFSPTEALVEPHVGKTLYTPRQAAQYIGTEILRTLSPDVHCLGLMKDQPKSGVLVVTDIRFPNELEFFANRFSTNFYPTYIANGRAEAVALVDTHSSEKHVADIARSSRRIENEGTIDDFHTKIVNYMDGIFSQYDVEALKAAGAK